MRGQKRACEFSLASMKKPLPQGPGHLVVRCQSLRQVVLGFHSSLTVVTPRRDSAGRGPELPTKARVPRRLPTGMGWSLVGKPKKACSPARLLAWPSRSRCLPAWDGCEQAAGGRGKRPFACQLQWLAAVLASHGSMAQHTAARRLVALGWHRTSRTCAPAHLARPLALPTARL